MDWEGRKCQKSVRLERAADMGEPTAQALLAELLTKQEHQDRLPLELQKGKRHSQGQFSLGCMFVFVGPYRGRGYQKRIPGPRRALVRRDVMHGALVPFNQGIAESPGDSACNTFF